MFAVFVVEDNNVDVIYGPLSQERALGKIAEILESYDVKYDGIVERAIGFDGDYIIGPRDVIGSTRICLRELEG